MGFKITIEVPLFLVTFGFMLTVSVNNNLLIYRTCYVTLGYNKSECAELGFVDNNVTEYLEKVVEPTADYIGLVQNNVESVLGSVLCLFVAPWSDRFGRKPILLLGLTGGTLAMITHIVFAAYESLSPWFIMLTTVPVLLTGGGASFMTVFSAYLADITSNEERGFRLGVFDVVMYLAILVGTSLSSYLLIATNYVLVYCISALCHLIALLFTIFFIPESLEERESENKIAELFKLSNFIQMVKTPFIRRGHSKRTVLLLIMTVLLLNYITQGAGSLGFYFLREKLHWTLTQYTWFGSIKNILGIVGTLLIIYLLHTVLHVKESVLIFIGFCFSVVSLIFTGFATKDWQIYFATIINLPSSGQNALTRSLISKLVHKDEIAKIFSAFTIGSTILSPLGSTGYTILYNATINTDPGLFNFVTAAIMSFAALIFMIILIVQQRAREDYAPLENDQNGNINENTEQIIATTIADRECSENS